MNYIRELGPHIHDAESVIKMGWKRVAALVPATIAWLLFHGLDALILMTCALSFAVLAELASRPLLGKRATIQDGDAVFSGMLFALLLPPTLTLWPVVLGIFFAILFGKEIWGGQGHQIVHPAVLGKAILLLLFPAAMSSSAFLDSEVSRNVLMVCILVGGIALLCGKQFFAELPCIYLATLTLGSLLLGFDFNQVVFSPPVLIAAFFLVTDNPTTPTTRKGRRAFAFVVALLMLLFRKLAMVEGAVIFSLLLCNAISPWLDQWTQKKVAL